MNRFLTLVLSFLVACCLAPDGRPLSSRPARLDSPRLQTTDDPVASDEEMIDHMGRLGLLADLGLEPDEALEAIRAIDVSAHHLRPTRSALSYTSAPPAGPTRWAAEFGETQAVIVTWPAHSPYHWPSSAEMVQQLVSAQVQVYVLVHDSFWQKAVELYLARFASLNLDPVRFVHVQTDRIWSRDYAPFSLRSARGPVLVSGHYAPDNLPPQPNDARVALEIARYLGRPYHRLPLVLEGGNLITDGQGTCLAFASILSRNPEVSRPEVEHLLAEYLGCRQVVLLPSLKNDPTAHVDMVAMFLDESTLLVAQSEPGHPWHDQLDRIASLLAQTPSASGHNYRVERVTLADNDEGSINFWSYTNSLIVNDTIVVPLFGVERYDQAALTTFRRLMPDHRVVGVSFGDVPVGAVHCATMQLILPGSSCLAHPTSQPLGARRRLPAIPCPCQ